MARTIFKDRLRTDGTAVGDSDGRLRYVVLVPKGSKLLTVQMQFDEPCVWYVVEDTHAETEFRTIHCCGTGLRLSEHADRHLGTTQEQGGALVLHYFTDNAEG